MWHDIVKAVDKKNGKEDRTQSQQRLKTALSKSRPSAGSGAPVWQNAAPTQASNISPGGGNKPAFGILQPAASSNGTHR